MRLLVKSLVLLAAVIFSINHAYAGVAGQSLDQENSALPYVDCSQISDMNRAQIFKPALNRIVSVEVYLAARANGAHITLNIMRESDSTTVGTVTQELSGAVNETWETFAFNDPYVTVTPEENYSLNLSSDEDQTRICYTGNNYARGFYRGLPDVDWLFQTYAISVADPVTPAPAAPTTSNSSNTSTAPTTSPKKTTTAPATTTTTSDSTPATATLNTNRTPVATVAVEPVPWYKNNFFWILSAVAFLLLALLTFLILRRRMVAHRTSQLK